MTEAGVPPANPLTFNGVVGGVVSEEDVVAVAVLE
jgi:hypothetical protein